MTVRDAAQVMDLLKRFYPAFYARQTEKERLEAADLWAVMFAQDDTRLVIAAVKSFIESDEKGFPPVPGQIKAKIRLIVSRQELSAGDAWNMVAKAIKNSGYEAKKEFDKLPPALRRVVGSPNQLRDWSMMDSNTVHSVVASNFQKIFRERAAKDREYDALPADVKELVDALTEVTMPELPAAKAEEHKTEPPKPVSAKAPEWLAEMRKHLREGRAQKSEQQIPRRSREEVILILRGGGA